MTLTVLQPNYLPSISWCARAMAAHRIAWAETFLYRKRSPINRTTIRSTTGPIRLTIPVKCAGRHGQRIGAAAIDNTSSWRRRHWRAIEICYGNSPYYLNYADELEKAYDRRWDDLEPFLYWSARFLLKACSVDHEIIKTGSLPVVNDRTERVIAWIEACRCSTYLLSPDELALIDADRIRRRGYRLSLFSRNAAAYAELSALDRIMNEGGLEIDSLENDVVAGE